MVAIVLAIIQARMGSVRFPGKVVADLHGEPMLMRQIERVKRAPYIGQVVVATSMDASDKAIVDAAHLAGAEAWRGDLHNVFDRMYRCAKHYDATHVVRLTGDCPLSDPDIIGSVVELHLDSGVDYTGNVEPYTYPDGLDVEVFTMEALVRAEALLRMTREHVTTLFRNGAYFRRATLRHGENLSHIRWTVDYPADLEKIRHIYKDLYDANPRFTWLDVLRWEGKHGTAK